MNGHLLRCQSALHLAIPEQAPSHRYSGRLLHRPSTSVDSRYAWRLSKSARIAGRWAVAVSAPKRAHAARLSTS